MHVFDFVHWGICGKTRDSNCCGRTQPCKILLAGLTRKNGANLVLTLEQDHCTLSHRRLSKCMIAFYRKILVPLSINFLERMTCFYGFPLPETFGRQNLYCTRNSIASNKLHL